MQGTFTGPFLHHPLLQPSNPHAERSRKHMATVAKSPRRLAYLGQLPMLGGRNRMGLYCGNKLVCGNWACSWTVGLLSSMETVSCFGEMDHWSELTLVFSSSCTVQINPMCSEVSSSPLFPVHCHQGTFELPEILGTYNFPRELVGISIPYDLCVC